jgi:cytochrome c oxidase assembly factor CtaG
MPVKSPDPQTSVLLFHWQTHWSSLIAIVLQLVVLAWYVRGVRRVTGSGRYWSPFRTGGFVLGLAVVAYAVEGGLAQYDRDNFSAHVVQLLLLIDVAPPLLASGAPIRLVLQSSRRRTNAFVMGVLHSRAARVASNPLVALAIASASMYLYFLTPVYPWSEAHPAFLAYVELHFLLVGCVLWWVIVSRDVLPRAPKLGMRFALVFLAVPVNAFLGLAVASESKPLYPAANTLADTQAGGNVLWGLAEIFIVAGLVYLFVDWAREEERKAVRADRQLDAALAAARAVVAASPEAKVGGN